MKQIILILTVSILLVSSVAIAQNQPVNKKDNGNMYTLFASGDTSLARWVPFTILKKGHVRALKDVENLIKNADIAMTNLECVVSSKGFFADKGERRPFLYRAPPSMLDVLTVVGFDVAVVANNHSGDYGSDALIEELELLEAAGIAQVGAGKNIDEASKPTYVKVGDIIVAFIGLESNFPQFEATQNKAGNFYAKEYTPAFKALKKIIDEAKKHSDLIIFTPHWGANWTDEPTKKRIQLAHALIDYGVDAIMGHSSHLFHGVEIYKGKPIVYDMGTFFFDTVKKMRMRFSLGFTFEFNKNGFRKLNMTPLLLGFSQTRLATGKSYKKIKTLIIDLTKKLSPNVKITDENNILSIEFSPDNKPSARKKEPNTVHKTGSTKMLPSELRNRRVNVVYDSPPDWTKEFKSVELENGVIILGGRSSEAVWPRRGFSAEIALKVKGSIKEDRWEAHIKGVSKNGEDQFSWRHPIADGAWTPYAWEKDQIVVDRTLVRPPTVAQGDYILYWRFENVSTGEHAKLVDPTQGDIDGFVRFGQIKITKTGIPSGAAGVAWDGILPGSKEFDKKTFDKAMSKSEQRHTWLWFAIPGFVLFLTVMIIGFVVIRRKKAMRIPQTNQTKYNE